MSAKDNQENINTTTDNIIKNFNNTSDNNVGFKDGFAGDVETVDINSPENTSHFSFKGHDVSMPADIVGVSFNPDHSVDNYRPLSTHGDTITQRTKALLQHFSVIYTMKESNHFRQQAQPIINELGNLVNHQTEQVKRYRSNLNFETNRRMAQSFLSRFFKTEQEKSIAFELEEAKKYIKHYQKLMFSILSHLRKYPINETEKRQLINDLNLDIKELLLQKKEAGFEFRRVQAKLQDEANSPPANSDRRPEPERRVVADKNKISTDDKNKTKLFDANEFNVFSLKPDKPTTNTSGGFLDFNGDGIFSMDDLDRAINNLFSSDRPKNLAVVDANQVKPALKNDTTPSKASSSTKKTMTASEKENKDIEIDRKIIALERNIIFLERFK